MKTQLPRGHAFDKVAFNLGSIKKNWNAFKNSPMPEHMLAGAMLGGAAGSVGGMAYGYDQDYNTQDRYARNGLLGGAALGALAGAGTGYRQSVRDAMDHMSHAGGHAAAQAEVRARRAAWESHRAESERAYAEAQARWHASGNAQRAAEDPQNWKKYEDAWNQTRTRYQSQHAWSGPQRGPQPGPQAGPQPGHQAGPQRGPQPGPQPGHQAGPQRGPQPGPRGSEAWDQARAENFRARAEEFKARARYRSQEAFSGSDVPFDHANHAVGSVPAPRVHVPYDDARHGAPLRKVWDTLQSSAEFHDPAVASVASEFMSAVGTAKGTPEYLKSLIAKLPPGSKASELFRVMMNRNIKTSAYLATWALFGFPT